MLFWPLAPVAFRPFGLSGENQGRPIKSTMCERASMISDEGRWYPNNQWHLIAVNVMPTSINDVGWKSTISERINEIRLKSTICQRAFMISDENQWSPKRINDIRSQSMICQRASMISGEINDWQNQGYPMELNDIPTKIKDVGWKSTTSN